MSETNNQKKVFVGLSGGVDSSVAALRLINEGYDVVGVFIKVWQPDFLKCDWEKERLDAMRVAAHLNIPFLTCDAEEEYKQNVGEYFINEYLSGRTPNPDVMCNRHVKFGAFWEFAKARGADFIATGHYAQVVKKEDHFSLLRGVDQGKDQSYFIWTLTEDDLSHTLFPVGNTKKEDIRKEAEAAKLPTAIKKDSQGICFLGHIDIPEFISHFTKLETGQVIDTSGQVIGEHQGALVYTLGQRHGFNIFGEHSNSPRYVVAKDVLTNTLVVNEEPPILLPDTQLEIVELNQLGSWPEDGVIEVMFRYRQTPLKCRAKNTNSGLRLEMLEQIDKPAAGQSVVFYLGEKCLGGGVVQ